MYKKKIRDYELKINIIANYTSSFVFKQRRVSKSRNVHRLEDLIVHLCV